MRIRIGKDMTPTQKENYELVLYRLDQIDRKLDEMANNYVTKEEFNSLVDEVHSLKKRNTLIGWLYPTASAAFSAIVTFLLLEYFRTH